MFELTVLFAAFGAFFGTLWLCGLPRLNFPMFSLPAFAEVSRSRFILCVEAQDPRFVLEYTSSHLQRLNPVHVWQVEKE